MKNHENPWKTNLEPCKTIKTALKPWKTNLEPRKTMKTYQEPWKTNLEQWKTMKTDLEPWKTKPWSTKRYVTNMHGAFKKVFIFRHSHGSNNMGPLRKCSFFVTPTGPTDLLDV